MIKLTNLLEEFNGTQTEYLDIVNKAEQEQQRAKKKLGFLFNFAFLEGVQNSVSVNLTRF